MSTDEKSMLLSSRGRFDLTTDITLTIHRRRQSNFIRQMRLAVYSSASGRNDTELEKLLSKVELVLVGGGVGQIAAEWHSKTAATIMPH
jgi:hypothetical protein